MSENLEALRAEAAEHLAALTAGLQEIATNPGPLVTESGKIIIDESTGEPHPNQAVRLKAMQVLFEAMRAIRNLASRPAYGTLDDLRAEIERRRKELGEADDGGDPGALGHDPLDCSI